MKKLTVILLPVVFLAMSCMNSNKPEKVEMRSQEQNQEQSEPEQLIENRGDEIAFADFTLKKPEAWVVREPSSEMRLVELVSPKSPENPIVGFYFGNRDEMVNANINRWRGQFAKEENFNRETMDDGQVYVEIDGTYKLKPFPMAQEFTETPDYKMLAAIIPSNKGPYFFKITGPASELNSLEEEFLSFLNSYKKE